MARKMTSATGSNLLRRSAFSLVELLLVLALLVTLLGVSLPSLTQMSQRTGDETAISAIRHGFLSARQQAIDIGHTVYWNPCHIDRMPFGYKVVGTNGNANAPTQIVLYPDGTCTDATLQVVGPNQFQCQLAIAGATGTLSIRNTP